MTSDCLSLVSADRGWVLIGADADRFALVNDYLGYLVDRNFSARTVRTYGIGLLAFCRWLATEGIELSAVTTDVLLRFLTACRAEHVAGWAGPNVVRMDGTRMDALSPATVNLRLAAVSGLFTFRSMRDPALVSPVPRREARHRSAGERGGMLSHVDRGVRQRSALRVRDVRRLPKSLDHKQVVALLGSLRSWRDRAIAGLMVFCGLRSADVLDLDVVDVDIGARWLLVNGKGAKQRRVPLDVAVAGVIRPICLLNAPKRRAAGCSSSRRARHAGITATDADPP